VAWQGGSLLILLAGVFGLLHLSSEYLQSRFVILFAGRRRDALRANRLYFTLMRPGVFAHELAHAIGAALVGGRVVGFNIFETQTVRGPGGPQVRLGHVRYTIQGRPNALSTRLRDAFVGLAPLPFGLLLIFGALLFSGVDWLHDPLEQLAAATRSWPFWPALVAVVEIADNMTPSQPDRRNWPAAAFVTLLGSIILWGSARLLNFSLDAATWTAGLQLALVLAGVLAVPIALNLVAGALLWLLARLLGR
jgi:hypothetical protein